MSLSTAGVPARFGKAQQVAAASFVSSAAARLRLVGATWDSPAVSHDSLSTLQSVSHAAEGQTQGLSCFDVQHAGLHHQFAAAGWPCYAS